ncbi:hypothetical protein BIW11_03255 [Tropilaelaps mercedesae]|uniref:Uncharacterized protein n=1 Tax=Tropilaelaps mercedesae TaxID=418985 RepID=A0A1V9XPN6_9ACAR|nr:hypothetical protein BIW11_03255 [Tropilaelaps mercedesae]
MLAAEDRLGKCVPHRQGPERTAKARCRLGIGQECRWQRKWIMVWETWAMREGNLVATAAVTAAIGKVLMWRGALIRESS